MKGNLATSYLIIGTAMIITAILSAYVVLHTAVSLEHRAVQANDTLSCVLSVSRAGQDPSSCLSDLNVPLEVNGTASFPG